MPLTYAQAEIVLAFVNGISPKRASAFRARLKQWQKAGFPEGINVGKGARAAYGAKQLFQLAFVLKLLQVGLTPERAQRVVLSGWPAIQDGILEAAVCLSNCADHRHYFLVQLDALSDLKEDEADHDHIFVEQFTGDHIAEAFGEPDGIETDDDRRRYEYFRFWVKNRMALTISIEIDSILILIWAAMEGGGIRPSIFADEIADWYRKRAAQGHAKQNEKSYFDPDSPEKGSIVERVQNFDVVTAAREMLADVQEEQRRKSTAVKARKKVRSKSGDR